MGITVYHNSRCSKSRCAIELLTEKGKSFEVIEYLKKPLKQEEIADLLKKLGIPAKELIRKNEADFKNNYLGKELSEKEWIEAMVTFPKLIERPIVVNSNKAVVGRPTERILDIL